MLHSASSHFRFSRARARGAASRARFWPNFGDGLVGKEINATVRRRLAIFEVTSLATSAFLT